MATKMNHPFLNDRKNQAKKNLKIILNAISNGDLEFL